MNRVYTRTRRSRPQLSAAYCGCSAKTHALCPNALRAMYKVRSNMDSRTRGYARASSFAPIVRVACSVPARGLLPPLL